MEKNSHCSYCGRAFEAGQPWPRICQGCGQISFLNPLPVAVTLLPMHGGLLAVRRAIPPHVGGLALPGGYLNLGETWQQGAAREVLEETGLSVAPDELRPFDVQSAPDGSLLIFALAQPHRLDALAQLTTKPGLDCVELPGLGGDGEASACCIVFNPALFAWELHRYEAQRFFSNHRGE